MLHGKLHLTSHRYKETEAALLLHKSVNGNLILTEL
jgi:hypothetical protein